jgi:outer membrane receptor protein involved in Fe transport
MLLGSSALLVLMGFGTAARAQVALPQVTVTGEKPKPKPKPHVVRRAPTRPAVTAARAAPPPPAAPATPPANAATVQNNAFDAARSNLYTTAGTTSDTLSHDTIQALPQGTNAPVEKILLQAPGVSQDSAASGLLHVRNDHANVQFRINGVMLPDGVTGFGSILDPSLIGSISLITGALPAEFGMRTVGLVDINTRNDIFNNSGSISYYGGSRGTIEPSIEYGGTIGNTCGSTTATGTAIATKAAPSTSDCFPGVQYLFTGRYLQTTEGIENPLPTLNAIHDFSQQDKGFAYMSTFVDPVTRLSLIAGTATSWFQIPNVPGGPLNPAMSSAFGVSNFNSAQLNENQYEDTQFSVLALQRSANGFDGQLSYFTRYNFLHFMPDPVGDLLLNGIASDITRESYANGIQGDASYIINSAHTLRTGFTVSAEQSAVGNQSLVEMLGAPGAGTCAAAAGGGQCGVEPPFTITDNVSETGWLAGVYAQDQWKLTNNLMVNYGARFDQMWQYVNANQLSPRVSFTYKPFEDTTFHAGYARYFTPPVLVEAAPANIALFNGTTGASSNVAAGASAASQTSPVLPERSNYFDAGVDQKIPLACASPTAPDCSILDLGIDAYYKLATDLIDNGNFGQALVLSAFNYAKGVTEGVEFSAKYHSGNLQAYGNLSVGQEKATDVVSNQYLFDNTVPLADLGGLTLQQYVDSHWIYTDHTQIVTGSAGVSYLWNGTTYSADMIYGSGLRTGDANIDSESPYAQFNVGASHVFDMPDGKPLTVRLDVVNLFDTIYQIRSGTGIGVFAPQYGPRRGYFIGVSKKI